MKKGTNPREKGLTSESISRRKIIQSLGIVAGISGFSIPPFLFQSCSKNQESTSSFLSEKEFHTIRLITEEIFPELSSHPVINGQALTSWIELMITDCLKKEEQMDFRSGMEEFINEFQSKSNKSKIEAGESLFSFLVEKDQLAFENDESQPAIIFFRRVKTWTVLGVFSAKETMEKLNYHPIPGDYKGCITINAEELVYVDNNVSG